jgi:hypothetical protein
VGALENPNCESNGKTKEELQLTIDIALHHLQKIAGNRREFLSCPLM